MFGRVFKIHSDFYYVDTDEGIFECKLREVLKKIREDIIVGDFVNIEKTGKSAGVIISGKARTNFLKRPKVANVSRVLIIFDVNSEKHDFVQLDRYICLCEYHKIKPILCFNKTDLLNDDKVFEYIRSIYEKCGYECIFISAKTGFNKEALERIFENNLTVLCGASGVGKSSVLNLFGINAKTSEVSVKTGRGTHTTRHCEIFKTGENSFVADTPGFSNLKFDFLLPEEISLLFPEIRNVKCKYANCLHVSEEGCFVKDNNLLCEERYKSYLQFIEEAREYKEKIKYSGKKEETYSKFNNGKHSVKISKPGRRNSRKTEKQNLARGSHDV